MKHSTPEYLTALRKLGNVLGNQQISPLVKLFDNSETRIPKLDLSALEGISKIQFPSAPLKVQGDISQLVLELKNQIKQLKEDLESSKEKADEVDKLREIIEQLRQKQGFQNLLSKVHPSAHEILVQDESFRKQFLDCEVEAFVVCVDIRRSTELMLKAKTPKRFANFIEALYSDIEEIFKENWAVIEKFTGDGILAYFPDFFSGKDAGYYALKSAKESNLAFIRRYKEFRTSFSSVLQDVGLGTGIDYGKVQLVQIAGSHTLVGQPVVYACRLSGAPIGDILLNQPAFEVINERYPQLTTILESSLKIKNEGNLICYNVIIDEKVFCPEMAAWRKAEGELDRKAQI